MLKLLTATAKLARGVAHAAVGLLTIVFRFSGMPATHRYARVQVWAARMLQILDIELIVKGTPPVSGPMLLVANHISWLDILVMHAARHCRFVSKSDVKNWPLVGRMATGAGTLYIARESRRDAMRVVHHMAESLREGDVVAVFPEGTTSDGTGLLPFHANLIQAAISAQSAVQPVALQFIDRATGQRSDAPNYVGDDSLVSSIWRTLTAPGLTAVLVFGEPQQRDGRDRRAWGADLRNSVEALLSRARTLDN